MKSVTLIDLLAIPALWVMSSCVQAQSVPDAALRQALAEVQAARNRTGVHQVMQKVTEQLGERAGVPETPDAKHPVPDVSLPAVRQVRQMFAPLAREISNHKWWRIGENPRQNSKKPRDVASVISGCVAAYRAEVEGRDSILGLARDAADYLLWTQAQAEVGLIPFPASKAGEGKVFGIAERAVKRLETQGEVSRFIRNGWLVEDAQLDDGGLQIDNAMGGVALLELYRVTGEQKYLNGALRAAEWAMTRLSVPNWNYNAFSVELLAEAYRETGRREFIERATEKVAVGVLPGQLAEGRYAGRWVDPHNARANYHYIIVRALARYVSVLEPEHPMRQVVVDALRLALQARNGDYLDGTVPNVESTLDALLVLELVLDDSGIVIGDVRQREVIHMLARIPVALFSSGKLPVSPVVWGRLLEYWIDNASGKESGQVAEEHG